MAKKTRWIASYTATKPINDGMAVAQSCLVVLAVSQDEAYGKAIRLARRGLPVAEGWGNHAAAIVSDSPSIVVDDPDDVKTFTHN